MRLEDQFGAQNYQPLDVETVIMTVRKWGYQIKGVPKEQFEINRMRKQLPWPHYHHCGVQYP